MSDNEIGKIQNLGQWLEGNFQNYILIFIGKIIKPFQSGEISEEENSRADI